MFSDSPFVVWKERPEFIRSVSTQVTPAYFSVRLVMVESCGWTSFKFVLLMAQNYLVQRSEDLLWCSRKNCHNISVTGTRISEQFLRECGSIGGLFTFRNLITLAIVVGRKNYEIGDVAYCSFRRYNSKLNMHNVLSFIHSFRSLSHDRSIASSKASSPHIVI